MGQSLHLSVPPMLKVPAAHKEQPFPEFDFRYPAAHAVQLPVEVSKPKPISLQTALHSVAIFAPGIERGVVAGQAVHFVCAAVAV